MATDSQVLVRDWKPWEPAVVHMDAPPRERVLAAASALFYAQGIRATGVDAIIERASVAKATFYRHFPAKEQLVHDWLAHDASQWLLTAQTQVADRSDDPVERILLFFDWLADWARRDHYRGCLFNNTALEVAELADEARQLVIGEQDRVAAYMETQCRAAGVKDAKLVSQQLRLLVAGAFTLSVARQSAEQMNLAKAAARRLLADALT